MVEKLISSEAAVTVFDSNIVGLNELKERLPVNCVECDVSDFEQVSLATAKYHQEFGAADVLIEQCRNPLQRTTDSDYAHRRCQARPSYVAKSLGCRSKFCFLYDLLCC